MPDVDSVLDHVGRLQTPPPLELSVSWNPKVSKPVKEVRSK